VGGDAGDVQASGAVFEERQCVEAFAEHGVEVEEVGRDDALGLGGEEFSPGRTAPAWCRVDVRVVQDPPDGRVGDAMVEAGQFPWIRRWPQRGFSLARRSTSDLVAARVGGRPVCRRAE